MATDDNELIQRLNTKLVGLNYTREHKIDIPNIQFIAYIKWNNILNSTHLCTIAQQYC